MTGPGLTVAAMATILIAVASAAFSQCAEPLPTVPSIEPADINFGAPHRARIATVDFDGIGDNETAITTVGFTIIRVDTAVAGTVMVWRHGSVFTCSFPAQGNYAVVFPFAPGADDRGRLRMTLRVESLTGRASRGTGTLAEGNAKAPLTTVAAIGAAVTELPPLCAAAASPGDLTSVTDRDRSLSKL